MLGKILVIALLLLGVVIGYEYYIGDFQTHPSTQSITPDITSSTNTIADLHYYNFSSSISIYSNGSATYIYPINLPSKGNVTITLSSNKPFHVKIIDNGTLLSQYSGNYYHNTILAGGKLELMFYNFTGNLNVTVNEVY